MACVLIAEPDPRIAKFLAGLLADFGHRVEAVDDLEQLIALLPSGKFDALVSDLLLCGALGRLLAKAANANGLALLTLTGQLPTAAADSHGISASTLADKPFRAEDLLRLRDALTGLARARPIAA
jgi:DNA-binding NtrC family response regulator